MIRKILFVIAIGMLVVVMTNCRPGGEPEPNATDVQLEKLTANWKCTQASRDDINQTGYDNFVVAISGTPGETSFGYTCNGRPSLSPWPSSGSWAFGTNVLTDITRDGSLSMTYSLSSDGNLLELNFDYQLAGNAGRTTEVKGQWSYRFTKQ